MSAMIQINKKLPPLYL